MGERHERVIRASEIVDLELRVHSYVTAPLQPVGKVQDMKADPFTYRGGGRWDIYPASEAGFPTMALGRGF